ncbi:MULTISPECIES: DUF2017 family protein [unclassified Cryobacterium]|uniref:DUF2017 family protein n=1 Tax=unclassified Cryobacterium TaxID=2649013 RepID=UPI0014471462|nr:MULTISPECIES: DUF2017 family protein [unclassified Cryobacterium]
MRGFERHQDGSISAKIDRDEALLLQSLASQLATLLQSPDDGDPAVIRLLPDAYPDDADASAEFRRFTQDGLVERKLHNATLVTTTLSAAVDSGELSLNPGETLAWMKALTDIRLTLASRLGIEREDDRSADIVLQDLYDWLGFVQNSLVEVLDS